MQTVPSSATTLRYTAPSLSKAQTIRFDLTPPAR
jgi:hypothetical protein